jgi:hypothetical protein
LRTPPRAVPFLPFSSRTSGFWFCYMDFISYLFHLSQ